MNALVIVGYFLVGLVSLSVLSVKTVMEIVRGVKLGTNCPDVEAFVMMGAVVDGIYDKSRGERTMLEMIMTYVINTVIWPIALYRNCDKIKEEYHDRMVEVILDYNYERRDRTLDI